VRVPDVVGRTRDEATRTLQEAGFEVRAVRRRSVRPRDTVTSQRPEAGTTAEEGSTVEMTVSNGPGIDEVPEVEGMPRSEAVDALEKAGFEVREERESSDTIKENRAIETDPPAGTQLEGGQTVTLVVSSGPPRVSVPDVVGQTQREATRTLEDAGFEVAVDRSENANVREGTVLAQDPSQGQLRKGSTVRIVVAVEPERVTVPSVGGSSLEQATATLRGLGLRVSSTEQPVTDPGQVGTVINQDPAPGTEVEPGDTVSLVVGREPDDQGDGGDEGPGGGPGGDGNLGDGDQENPGQGPQGDGPPGLEDGTG
jgi:serine/threonine-protein kinase